jgi:Mn-dependent DtxR family transcriptional regulator
MLEPYEEVVILRMYDKNYEGMNYKSIQKIAASIKWADISNTYGVKKKFSRVLKHLYAKGYVDLHGKSGDVASLTRLGVEYAFARTRGSDGRAVT